MPRAGLEPAREYSGDFKSPASTIPPPRLTRERPCLTDMIIDFKGSPEEILQGMATGTILKTSGSMGVPKAIFHTWEQHVLAAQAVIANTQLDKNSVSLLSLPLHHISGLAILVRAWVSGGRWALPEKGWAGVTHVSLVSTQLKRFLENQESVKALRKMKAILLGGSAISKTLIQQAYQEDLPIIMTYGSTETASQVTATCLGDSLDRLFTSGKCLPDREIQISQTGEILVKGDMLYQPGWYSTGDLGSLDSQGYLNVLGRLDNRLISGGENIYPEEIEKALLEHPQIESVVVVAKNDEEYGQRPVVFLKMSSDINTQELQSFLTDRLERFKIPKDWRRWPSGVPESFKINRSFFAKLVG